MPKFNINNVNSFRGFDVFNGQVDISEAFYEEMLDDIYGDVEVCGLTYSAGRALKACDPIAFRVGLGDFESETQAELEEALENEDYSDIEWIEEPEDEE